MARKGRRSTHEERIQVVRLVEQGWAPERIAEALDVSRSSVFDWIKRYREGGLEELSTKFASGRPTILTDQQMLKLYTIVVGKDPRQLNLGAALWTRKLVAEAIKVNFGIRLSLVTVGRILKKLGMSPQRPLYRAYQQDPQRVKIWKEKTFPNIKKEAKIVGATIFFADESGIRTDHHAGTTWAPVGRTPVVTASGNRTSVNMISAISTRGEIHFNVLEGTINAARFIEFCEMLLEDCGDSPAFLVVDGSSIHTAKAVKEFVLSTKGKLKIFFLPPYSPELNPDEWVWKNVKNDQIKRAVPLNKSELRHLAHQALEHLRNSPQTVRAFFGDPDLAYIRKS